jgi:TPR repeat protein
MRRFALSDFRCLPVNQIKIRLVFVLILVLPLLVACDGGKSASKLRTLAENGDVKAQVKLADGYRNGDGVGRDLQQAVLWYRKAAENDDAEAKCKLGICYHLGIGMPADFSEAVVWYKRSAAQDYALAQAKLGLCYATGEGVTKDFAESARWYRKAAIHGNSSAQFQLGGYLWIGLGVKKDQIEAYAYMNLAAASDESARVNLEKLQKNMSMEIIVAGQNRTKELQVEIEAIKSGR